MTLLYFDILPGITEKRKLPNEFFYPISDQCFISKLSEDIRNPVN